MKQENQSFTILIVLRQDHISLDEPNSCGGGRMPNLLRDSCSLREFFGLQLTLISWSELFSFISSPFPVKKELQSL